MSGTYFKDMSDQGSLRTYKRSEAVVFRKTKEKFGGLSNMAAGFPLVVNGIHIRSSEALYQACRFPDLPDVQRQILSQVSPMTAKMKGKPYREQTRPDWLQVRLLIMRWCLRIKLAQNWESFGHLLLTTGDKPIVEESSKDEFWGAKPVDDDTLIGTNALGRLLMELREELRGPNASSLKIVHPLNIPNFVLVGQPIKAVEASDDERNNKLSKAIPLISFEQKELIGYPATPQSQEQPVSSKGVHNLNLYPKRLIEVDLPIKKISAHARREKSIRHGHISTLHIWWARRPLAACRAVICAALWPDPADDLCPQAFRDAAAKILPEFAEQVRNDAEVAGLVANHWQRWHRTNAVTFHPADNFAVWPDMREALLDFIADFANWDASTVPAFLNTARALTQAAHESLGGLPGTRPLVVDPFAGGGAIPLEALRVGADAFASDLNPVAVLLNKVVLEYIPKYGQRLTDEVRKWGQWIKEQAEQELAEFYPKDPDGATPIAYLWARTIICEGPGCGVEVPLIRSVWISKRQSIALKIQPTKDANGIGLSLISGVRERDLQEGTVRRGSVTCPCCSYTTARERVEAQMKEKQHSPRLLTVVTASPGGKRYRLPTENDLKALKLVDEKLKDKSLDLFIPHEELPYLRSIFNVHIYGIQSWASLFDNRQRLAMATLVCVIARLPEFITKSEPELMEATCACLALAVDRLADFNTNIARWANHRETSAATFGRQALGMVWDYCETVPISDSTGSLSGSIEWVLRVCEAISVANLEVGQVQQVSAANHPLPDDIASVIFTDPPYYDAVPYANLSDFFYVWLKKSIGKLYPGLFSGDETPKKGEAVQLAERNPKYSYKTREYFEDLMAASFSNGRRYTQPTGLGIIVFAHKTTSAWETLLSAVVQAGWTITASWPLDTEMASRLRARDSAALASSIHLVCRPRESSDGSLLTDYIGDWRDVLQELPRRIHSWLPRLAQEGVVGADAIFACLGPALEIFSRYSRVETPGGQTIPLGDVKDKTGKVVQRGYLSYVWEAVSKEALTMVFEGADATGFEEDARLTAMWLWTLNTDQGPGIRGQGSEEETEEEDEETNGAGKKIVGGFSLEYDAARKIAQGLGAYLENLDHLVEIKGSTARLRAVSERARYLFGQDGLETASRPARKRQQQMSLFETSAADEAATSEVWGELSATSLGQTVLDRVHQSMLLFAAGRSEALKRFLVDEGVGQNARFWQLANALSALYPPGTDEKRWVEGVLARKKGLGF